MFQIRDFLEIDSKAVGRLIADTYAQFNLDFISPNEKGPYLGPFQHAYSPSPEHQAAVTRMIRAEIIYVAEHHPGELIGVLRGRPERLHSLFVDGKYHRQGVGTALLHRFETECIKRDGKAIRLASTLYAVPFYLRMGYVRSTGIRRGWSFQGNGLLWQPMKKILKRA